MEPCRHKSHPQSPSAGRCAAYRRTLHHHEQLVLQTFVQAWVWSRALCFPQHLLLIHQEDEEDQRGRGSLQLGEHTLLAICFELKMFDICLKAFLGTCERGEFDDKNLCLTDCFVSFQSESQDQVFLRWTTGETATMHILVVHAMVILLTLGPPKGNPAYFYNVCNVKEHAYHSVCLQERAISTLFWTFGFLTRNLSPLPSWLTPQKRRFCCLIGWNWGWSDPRSLGWLMQVQLVIVQTKKGVAHHVHFYLLTEQYICFPQRCKTWSLSSCCYLYSPLAFQYPAWANYCSTWTRLSPMTHRRWKRTSWTSVRVLILRFIVLKYLGSI